MGRKEKEKKPTILDLPRKAYIFWRADWVDGQPYLHCVEAIRDTKEAVGPIGEYALLVKGDVTVVFTPKKKTLG